MLKEHTRNVIGINTMGDAVLGKTVDKKTNIVARVRSYAMHIYMFEIKQHKSDNVWEVFLLKIKAVSVSNGPWVDLSNLKIGLHFAIPICLIQTLLKEGGNLP